MEYDPNKIYQTMAVISNFYREKYPEYEMMMRRDLMEKIAPYPGVLYVYEEEDKTLGGLLVRYEKVPPHIHARREAKKLAQAQKLLQ